MCSKRTIIGKIDPKTGKPAYKNEYIERMRIAGTHITNDDDIKRFSENDIKETTLKEIDLTELLDKIGHETGLIEVLKVSNPQYSGGIFTMAKHLAANSEPFMHCQEWVDKVEIHEKIESL